MSKILTDSKRLNLIIILSLIFFIYIIIIGLIYAPLGTFMTYHVTFIGKTESDIKAYSP